MAVPTLFFSASERKQINIDVQSKALAPNRGCLRRLSARGCAAARSAAKKTA